MKSQEFKMPAFGVGPIYVITCLILTIAGICLHLNEYIYQGELSQGKIFFIIAGIFMILLGIYLWIQAVIVQKINKKVTEKKLITTGVYSIVRNPVYSAFIFIFTVLLLFTANYILLILPFVFWAFLTILMKNTEEKWLKNEFGEEYEIYLKQVNRVIPRIRRK
ncbi:MAG: isoprenylcysteine carboxylmethyltransferase family protein [Finegoldia magna]|uniref:methyltransferase family protein n=1 Tax=Finegoldia magna TaxID=1260 RepID=UPI002906903F|nr:isoprenylcysteine carboxylmethyltransferase family protein [Finegoldia magna]MDU5223881.1 isoprenylcysteine carboxylmethyltransferase family protein [Finegoldia magna]MDU5236596.1 isoprenylcysteine carboxylmethyltransferase family protein [Finegoldia magna]